MSDSLTDEQLQPQLPAPPPPMHTRIMSPISHTSEFAKYFLAALPSRYIFRGILGTSFYKHAPEFIKGPVNKFLDYIALGKIEKGVTAAFKDHSLSGYSHGMDAEQIEDLLKASENSALKTKLSKAIKPYGASGLELGELVHAYHKDGQNFSKATEKYIRSAVRDHVGKIGYGLALGIGSSLLTASYTNTVYTDLKHLFGEAVGYELNKDPRDVTFTDLRHSNNKIVQQSVDKFLNRTLQRVATDIPFFLSGKLPNVEIADTMIGVKGLQLFFDSWRRKSTMFENLVEIVLNKITPNNGLGQQISVGEVFDLYQHYSDHTKTNKMFSTIIKRNDSDSILWTQSQPIFARITELMNKTYAYKHEAKFDDSGKLIIQADFPLPKFIHLLGNDLIQPSKPEQTLAYIEIANSYGMNAVRDMQNRLASGTNLQQIKEIYPIAKAELPAKPNNGSEVKLNDKPATSVSTSNLRHHGEASVDFSHLATSAV